MCLHACRCKNTLKCSIAICIGTHTPCWYSHQQASVHALIHTFKVKHIHTHTHTHTQTDTLTHVCQHFLCPFILHLICARKIIMYTQAHSCSQEVHSHKYTHTHTCKKAQRARTHTHAHTHTHTHLTSREHVDFLLFVCLFVCCFALLCFGLSINLIVSHCLAAVRLASPPPIKSRMLWGTVGSTSVTSTMSPPPPTSPPLPPTSCSTRTAQTASCSHCCWRNKSGLC